MYRSTKNILALLLGVAFGFFVGILFAPNRGTNIRNVFSYRVKRSIERLHELIRILSKAKITIESKAKTASQEVINTTIEEAKQLLKEANELSDQLESGKAVKKN